MTSALEARNALVGALETAWTASSVTTSLDLQFDNVRDDPPEAVDAEGFPVSWGRITMRHTAGAQETLGDVGARRFDSSGIVTVQIFTAPGDGHAASDLIVPVIRTALQDLRSTDGVWVTGISPPIEVGITGAWFQVNVTGAFRYEETA